MTATFYTIVDTNAKNAIDDLAEALQNGTVFTEKSEALRSLECYDPGFAVRKLVIKVELP